MTETEPDFKVLSVRQPSAELIILGRKKYEIRSWSTNYRGPLWIHAGLNLDKDATSRSDLDPEALERGAVIGTVEVVDCIPYTEAIRDELNRSHGHLAPWKPDHFAWELASPCRLAQPVPSRGQLGFFKVPDLDRENLI